MKEERRARANGGRKRVRSITRADLQQVLQEAIAHGKIEIGIEPLQHIQDHTKVIPELVTSMDRMSGDVGVIHGWVNGKIVREKQWRERRHRAVNSFIEGASGTFGKIVAGLLTIAALGAGALKLLE